MSHVQCPRVISSVNREKRFLLDPRFWSTEFFWQVLVPVGSVVICWRHRLRRFGILFKPSETDSGSAEVQPGKGELGVGG